MILVAARIGVAISMPNQRLDTRDLYGKPLRRTLRQIIDFISFFAAIAIVLIMVRAEEIDLRVAVVFASLLGFTIIPSIFLRDDRHLPLRGGLVVLGILIPIFAGFLRAGSASFALAGMPFYFALFATLFTRKLTFLMFATFVAFVVIVAGMFSAGLLTSPKVTLFEWNQDPRNWLIMLLVVITNGLMSIFLVHSLRSNWQNTSGEAAQAMAQLQDMVEYANEAILIVDLDTNQFIAANGRSVDLFGLATDALINGPTYLDLSPQMQPSGKSSAALAQTSIATVLQTGQAVFSWTFIGSAGQEIDCEVSLRIIPTHDRNLARVSIADISRRVAEERERESMKLQLEASRRLEAIGKLTGGVAHDFNNILAVILGNLELLKDEQNDGSSIEIIETCINAALRGGDLTNNMLAFARQAPLTPQQLDINKLVEETQSWARRTLPTNIHVALSLAPDLWITNADPTAVSNALLNLLINARDAMPDGGDLTVTTQNETSHRPGRTRGAGRYAVLIVSDTGIGMDESTVEKAFDPFFTTKPAGQGSGLGLSMIQGLMRQSGGGVEISSTPDAGTTIRLSFPAAAMSEASDSDHDQETSAAQPKGQSVLVVDDQEDVADMVARMVVSEGYAVEVAYSGDEAIKIIDNSTDIDLLLTDIVMPGKLQGPDLAKAIRARQMNIPIILMSGYSNKDENTESAWEAGCIRLMKPFKREQLLAAMAEALADPKG